MHPFVKYLLCALLPFGGAMAAWSWFAGPATAYVDYSGALYFRAKSFWGGNPSEVYSHFLDMWACSGVFAGLVLLLVAERILRRHEIAWRGSWTAAVGSAFAVLSWGICLHCDRHFGEGTVILAVPIFFLPLLLLVLPPLHLLLHRLKSIAAVLVCGLLAMGLMVGGQLVFEPSDNGGPNILTVTAWMCGAVAWVCGLSAIVWSRRYLQEKGYWLFRWTDAVFVALNLPRGTFVPPHEEMAVLPEFDGQDVRSLCRVALGMCDSAARVR